MDTDKKARLRKERDPRRILMRKEIVQKAAVLFQQHGYRGVSVDSIADGVGISKPTFYAYLDSKDEIVWEIYEVIRLESLKLARAVASTDVSAREKLGMLVHGHLEALVAKREFYAVYFQEESELPPRLQHKHRAAQKEYQKTLEEVLAQGSNDGVFPQVDPKIASLGLLGMCNWVCRWYKPDGPLTASQIADNFMAILAHS